MNTIKLLDVTLRDGGNRIDFHFNPNDLKHILVPLDRSGIDYIEIGYRNGSIHPVANIGTAGMCAKDYLLYCRSLIKTASIAVMVHPKNITADDLLEMQASGVSLLRICVLKGALGIRDGGNLVARGADALDDLRRKTRTGGPPSATEEGAGAAEEGRTSSQREEISSALS